MAQESFTYVIVGGGLTGVSAVEGIREHDSEGSILLIGAENHLPYHRPPLTKSLWFGTKEVKDIFVQPADFFQKNGVQTRLGSVVTGLDPDNKTITCHDGYQSGFERLLLATGGVPKKLSIPGGDEPGICYYRNLDDYTRIRGQAKPGARALVIGAGFIGSEIAAALSSNGVEVTMLFPEDYLCARVFPESLGTAVLQKYREKGVGVAQGDAPVSIEKKNGAFTTRTKNGQQIDSDIVIAGIGIAPAVELARGAGLAVGNGIELNEYLQTSSPSVYAAGDNALHYYPALNRKYRIEHWDCALTQGRHAGENMAGAGKPFTTLPYFFSDLFDFGYEAVGDTNPSLTICTDWQKENEKGVIYYCSDHHVRGAMMCNVWDKVDAARKLIESGETIEEPQLAGTIG
jgi:NADPH-dependent 2,4-dienoyl-CoA reductase/sulfur reductase-like enzyme